MITDVVIVGGGPNGLTLAGVRPIVLERLAAASTEPKANGLLGQVVRMVDRRGLYECLSGKPGAAAAELRVFHGAWTGRASVVGGPWDCRPTERAAPGRRAAPSDGAVGLLLAGQPQPDGRDPGVHP
ncbi:FAD-dependent oxidoreductase [Nonomuraea sp. CA-141351]|uniref:FAD-dependent oxidoreductase n=1 Tax=Nonomuraea sp. CA-141351 TaxID=3239996 RepID=UPI003D9452A4